MTRYTFGESIEEGDILEIQGVQYHMIPLGMRAMRKMMAIRSLVAPNGNDEALAEDRINAGIDMIVDSVVKEEREALREHIEDRVPPNLLVQISMAIAQAMSDLDPTLLPSSLNGSSAAGSPSTDTAPLVESTPSL
jgi:hypothetical protein